MSALTPQGSVTFFNFLFFFLFSICALMTQQGGTDVGLYRAERCANSPQLCLADNLVDSQALRDITLSQQKFLSHQFSRLFDKFGSLLK